MIKDIKYIIKKIIIGIGIALAIMFIKTNVFASEISPYTWNGIYWDESSGVSTLTWNVPNSPWSNHGNGILRFTVGITKTSGSSTDPLIVPRMISAYNGNTRYVCDIGTASGNNSTFVGNTYSVSCPMNLDSNGVSQILLAFMPFSTQAPTPTYRIYISPDASYEVFDSTNVNVSVNNSGTIANDNQNTQSIINNQNSNTQDIIDNQNQNTQDTIDSQKVCSFIDKSNVVLIDRYLLNNGVIQTQSYAKNWGITDYINIQSSEIEKLSTYGSGPSLCFYNVNKELISCSQNVNVPIGSLTIPENSSYVRFSISTTENKPQYKICTNGNQAIVNSQQNINNTLNDNSPVNNSTIEELFGDIESSDTPISDLLTMPITLLQAYISGMSGTCNRIELGQLYGNLLFIPCINISNYLGSDLWNLIDIVLAMYLIYEFSQLLITAFDSITSLKDNFSWLFGVEGKHVGSPSTRVERNSDLY